MKISHNENGNEYEINLDQQGNQSIRVSFNEVKDQDGYIDWEEGSYTIPYEMINPIIARLKDLRDGF